MNDLIQQKKAIIIFIIPDYRWLKFVHYFEKVYRVFEMIQNKKSLVLKKDLSSYHLENLVRARSDAV